MKKIKSFKNLFIISSLLIALIGSNYLWYKIYNKEIKRVKNSLIPSLTNDYYSNQLILTNNIKRYENNNFYEYPMQDNKILEDKYLTDKNEYLIYDVPLISQLPDYPNGCEAASAVMLLKFYGVNITLEEFFNYLPKDKVYTKNGTRYGPNPALFYAGNPKSKTSGWGCFDIVIAKTINKILAEKNPDLVSNLKNNIEPLKNLAYNGPTLIWVTIDYSEAEEIFTWTSYDKNELILIQKMNTLLF